MLNRATSITSGVAPRLTSGLSHGTVDAFPPVSVARQWRNVGRLKINAMSRKDLHISRRHHRAAWGAARSLDIDRALSSFISLGQPNSAIQSAATQAIIWGFSLKVPVAITWRREVLRSQVQTRQLGRYSISSTGLCCQLRPLPIILTGCTAPISATSLSMLGFKPFWNQALWR